jgi:putative membrane protein
MNTPKQTICCALFCAVVSLSPSRVLAATDDDKKFLAAAAQADINEIKLSQLAEQKASNPAVKAFAEKMVTEPSL